jgi:hypothetical protein
MPELPEAMELEGLAADEDGGLPILMRVVAAAVEQQVVILLEVGCRGVV